ncbi:hypothetical protein [Bradyrhizobium sp. SZCCHNRI2049]|uniref:hypothetical protein n=1 Tax=Bradyrhizobium sp. SZCCHNRI2049 TaxID=3057287 RepID=UPI002916A0F7|nr:hypothetical protein [Bradyrhizobium sp. SZCCHNRI2049]
MSPICHRPSGWTPDDTAYTVRDAIRSGALPDLTVTEFDEKMDSLSPAERDDFVQELWDRL